MSLLGAAAGMARRRASGGLSGSVTIAFFGDSITQGQGSTDSLGSRETLRLALVSALPGVTCTFVGPYGSAPNQHGGDPGATISEVQANYEAWIATPTPPPDIVLLMAGTNDCDLAGPTYDGPTAQAALGTLINKIHELGPNTQVVVYSPPTVNPSDTDPDDETLRANLADFAPRALLEARKRSCLTIDLHTDSLSWDPADFTDDVHPADPGYTKKAAFEQPQTIQAIGRILAPSSYPQAAEIVTDPTISTPVVGVAATITPGIVDAFPPPLPTNTFRVLDAADDSLISDRGTNTSYTPVLGDVGKQLKIEQTSGADVRTGPASTAVASPIAFPTTNLVFAFEARADVSESGGLVTQIDGQHGSTPVATASGSARPDYRATDGYLGGPALRFGAPATGGDATKLDVSAALRATAGDCTIAFLFNPENATTGTQQWLAGFTDSGVPSSLIGPLHIRSNTVPRPSWYDGAYRSLAVNAQTGWQLLTFRISGTTLRIYRGRTQIGSDLTVTPRALTTPTIGNVAAGGFPLDGLIEGVWAFDAAITLADLWDWIEQEWPGIAP